MWQLINGVLHRQDKTNYYYVAYESFWLRQQWKIINILLPISLSHKNDLSNALYSNLQPFSSAQI